MIEQSNSKGNTRDLFEASIDITGTSTPRIGIVKNKQGKDLSEAVEVKARWKEYTEDLYRCDSIISEEFLAKDFTREPSISESEVIRAMKEGANGKAPGIDNIPIELFKEGGNEAIVMITKICNRIWDTAEWPRQWKQSIYIPLPRKGDPRACENNRTISRIVHASKIVLKVIQKHLEQYLEREIPDKQSGFRKNRGTRDQISNLRRLMETTREYQSKVYMGFIDYSEAFDCVDHQALLNSLREMGNSEHMIVLLRGLYND